MSIKSDKFKRLAQQRGERILKDVRLLGNLSNKNNYDYTDQEINKVFGAIEEELRMSRARFHRQKKRKIEL
jgi:hypothetical protein